ncbi:hypothetical protein [Brazilian marseillevirus]|uniref:hypothetical protein n=1 Tax=Brazilian marseillevirus TaxID=1813599 RepID=UPI000781C75E|nr:hypothetical protein A3303_gp301 [Brazilian marseillevirus]AMQ10809.1 hypothetical protein [Brazilian marseillevirus]
MENIFLLKMLANFLEKREVASLALVTEARVDIQRFLTRRVVRDGETTKEETILPDGSFHGTRILENKEFVESQEYFFGKRHGRYHVLDKEKETEYVGVFTDGTPIGSFAIASGGQLISAVFYDEEGNVIRHKHHSFGKCPLKCRMYGHDLDYPHEFSWTFSSETEMTFVSSLMGKGEYIAEFSEIHEKEKENCWDYFLSCRRIKFLPEQTRPEFLFSRKIKEKNKPQGKPLRRICLP